jgi:hypothetical protein
MHLLVSFYHRFRIPRHKNHPPQNGYHLRFLYDPIILLEKVVTSLEITHPFVKQKSLGHRTQGLIEVGGETNLLHTIKLIPRKSPAFGFNFFSASWGSRIAAA